MQGGKAIFDRNLKSHWNETDKKDTGKKNERWCIDKLKSFSIENSSTYNDLLSVSIPKVSYKIDPIFSLSFVFFWISFNFVSFQQPLNRRRRNGWKSYFLSNFTEAFLLLKSTASPDYLMADHVHFYKNISRGEPLVCSLTHAHFEDV